jgi:hypothetical protein
MKQVVPAAIVMHSTDSFLRGWVGKEDRVVVVMMLIPQ